MVVLSSKLGHFLRPRRSCVEEHFLGWKMGGVNFYVDSRASGSRVKSRVIALIFDITSEGKA